MNCLECDARMIPPKDPLEGELVTCPDCGVSFELVGNGNDGFNLRPALVEGEDWGE